MSEKRVALARPFTPTEEVVVELIGRRLNLTQIGVKLGLTKNAVNFHISRAAGKIPGELPRKVRILLWYRGATLELLGGYHTGSDSASRTQ